MHIMQNIFFVPGFDILCSFSTRNNMNANKSNEQGKNQLSSCHSFNHIPVEGMGLWPLAIDSHVT